MGDADREPPRMLLLPAPDQALRGEDYAVWVTLLDNRKTDLLAAKLQWRPLSSTQWREIAMQPNVAGRANTFVAAIPSQGLTTATPVEYRVEASDGTNSTSSSRQTLTLLDPTTARPGAAENIRVARENDATEVRWDPGSDAFLYRIYRGSTPDFEPGPDTYLTYVAARQNVFRDSATPSENHFYEVVAVSAEGRTPRANTDVD